MGSSTKGLFTLDEAVRMLPLVRSIVSDLVTDFRALRTAGRERRALAFEGTGPGLASHAQDLERLVRALSDRVESCLRELSALGLETRDLELGSVDFPTLMGSEPAFYCWRLDEPTIAFWHAADAAHKQRVPIEGAAVPA